MKFGLGEPYDKVEYLPRKIRAYIDLTKPASSVGVGLGYLLASLFYFYYVGGGGSVAAIQEKLFSIIYVSLTMFLAHSAAQTLNMSEDAEMDSQTPHKMNRPIPSGEVTVDEARALATILSLFALGRGFMVNWRFGVFVSILLFMGVFYSLEPLRIKETVLTIPWQAVSRGLLVFPTVWAAYGNPFAPEAWALGAFLFFYVLAFQNSADIVDEEVDREFGISTWVVEYGLDNVTRIATVCLLAMMLVLVESIQMGILPLRMAWLGMIAPFCVLMIHYMRSYPERVSETTGNHPAWLWYYFGLVAIITIPLIVEVVYA